MNSAILDPIDSTKFHHMGAGSTLKSGRFHALRIC